MQGSECNKESLEWATEQIVKPNKLEIKIAYQANPDKVLEGVIGKEDHFDFTMCNPPFFASREERNQRRSTVQKDGIELSEEVTSGGEAAFLQRYAQESVFYASQVDWFTSLTGKRATFEFQKTYLREMVKSDKQLVITSGTVEVGMTKRWIIAWRFI